MARRVSILGFVLILPCAALLTAQQTQKAQTQSSGSQPVASAQPAQPTSSVYNRMRKLPAEGQQQTTQAQQFPGAAGHFPPDQQAPAAAGQRPPLTIPQPTLSGQPASPQSSQTQAPQTQGGQQNASQSQPAQTLTGPAQQPANPPRISYVGGLLTIAAENSSLTDILTTVQRLTHAQLEGTQPRSERVFGQFGPGTPRDVLNSLLSGSRYDFILVGAIDDPGGVDRIMLSPRANSASGNTTGNQTAVRQNIPTSSQDTDDDNEGIAQVPEPQQAPVPQQQPPHVPPGQQQVKTPEQLLEELQRLRQQQQQQPQQTNPPR